MACWYHGITQSCCQWIGMLTMRCAGDLPWNQVTFILPSYLVSSNHVQSPCTVFVGHITLYPGSCNQHLCVYHPGQVSIQETFGISKFPKGLQIDRHWLGPLVRPLTWGYLMIFNASKPWQTGRWSNALVEAVMVLWDGRLLLYRCVDEPIHDSIWVVSQTCAHPGRK